MPSGGGAAEAARNFVYSQDKVLILSYDAARAHTQQLVQAPVGLLICDEGHRIKSSAGNLTIDALKSFTRAKRVILTGTPMQNDLSEFWAMVDFVCPGELGSLSSFSAEIVSPINAGRQPDAGTVERELSDMATERLRELTEPLVLRRDTSVLKALLPDRHELAIFVRLSAAQANAYQRVIDSAPAEETLKAIGQLQAVCSYANTATGSLDETGTWPAEEGGSGAAAAEDIAKVALLMRLLEPVRAAGEKVVLCSGFCRCLDLVQAAISARGWGALRLDGTTPIGMRQQLVDRFNSHGIADSFAFLLSTRAGGTGLNLVGGSRLVLLDPDWNPAADDQAMGRVYRDGQKREVHVWRLLSTGTVEERIYQRQIYKKGLDSLIEERTATESRAATAAEGDRGGAGGRPGSGGITAEERKAIFTFDADVPSSTLSALIQGDRQRLLTVAGPERGWIDALPDPLLRSALQFGRESHAVSFACDVGLLAGLAEEAATAMSLAHSKAEEGGAYHGEEEAEEDEEDWDDDEADEESDDASLPDEGGATRRETCCGGGGGGGASQLELDSDHEDGRDGTSQVRRPSLAPAKKRLRLQRTIADASGSEASD